MIDSRVRDDFYGLDSDKIFFNNASYGPLLKVVKARMDEYFQMIQNLKVGDLESYEKRQLCREYAAKLIGASIDEVEFAINTSYGINLAVLGLDYQEGDEVVMPDNEFPSVPYPFKTLESRGVKIKYVPSVDRNFSFDNMLDQITDRTKVLAISFVQFFNGFKNDIKRLGEFCKKRDIFFVVDAIQGLGVCPLDVKECHVDLLACGAQKWLLAPLGSGFFYISDQAKRDVKSRTTGWLGVDWNLDYTDLLHVDRDPFDDARRFNLGTYPYLQTWVMEAALAYILDLGVQNIFEHTQELIDQLLEFVQADDFYAVNSSLEPLHRSQIINISSPAGPELHKHLLREGIYQVYREGGVRIAVNFYNTPEEIEKLVEVFKTFKEQYSGVGA